MIGSATRCAGCGKAMLSCVRPAYCWNCNPNTKQFREMLAEKEAGGLPDEPILVEVSKEK